MAMQRSPAQGVITTPNVREDVAPDNQPSSRPVASETTSELGGGVTGRVVVLCLALAVLFGYVIPLIDVKFSNTFLGAAHLPPGALAVLLILLLVINPLLRLISRHLAFSRNETITVYITCLFSCLVPGHGAENFFVSNLIGTFYFATRENKWLTFLQPYLKPWFTPALRGGTYGEAGQKLVNDWYTGSNGVVPWGAWLVPLVLWGAFIFASYIMLGCLSVIVRAQWAEREALAFPLLRLPLELTEDVDRDDKYGVIGRFFRNPLMWIGFGIGMFIQVLNGLNFYFPLVPKVPLDINTGALFTEPPWNQIGWVPMQVYPIAVGITYLLTSEVSFSFWFFYWFMRLQLIGAYMLGFVPNSLPNALGSTGGAKAFNGYQQIGSFLGYAAIVLWTGREHFAYVVRRAFGRAPARPSEKDEALSYPVAFWGFVLSFAFMVGWSIAAGIRPDVALLMWGLYIVIAIALTRVVVEGGLLFVQHGWAPLAAIAQITNAGPGYYLPASSIVPGSIIQTAMITDLRAFLMPSFVQSFKLAYDRKINLRALTALIFAVISITLVMGIWMHVRLGYQSGGLQLEAWFAQDGAKKPASDADALIKGVTDASYFNLVWVALGALMTYGMMLARSRFLWFPFHPLGLLMSLTYPMNRLWFSVFLGWMSKVLITRFGGSETYRKTTPLFLGLALGDVATMLLWLAIDAWQVTIKHQLMPG